jgi:predicted amidophosphoribosyltransferase
VLDLLLPSRCAVCRGAGPGLCPTCAATLPPAPDLPPPPGLVACPALLAYDGPTRDLLVALKFRGHRDAVDALGRALAVLVADLAALVPGAFLTWAPTSRARRRSRGYDQADLLARATARAADLDRRRLLERLPGPAQTGRDRAHRLGGPAFRAVGPVPRSVVVLDDVRTTGATLSAAAAALRAGGAEQVAGVVLAVRP